MKPTLSSLRKYQNVWALVDEVIALNEIIINFSGDLIRVKNETDRILRGGQRVLLQVEETYPKLKLRLVTTAESKIHFPQSIDVQI